MLEILICGGSRGRTGRKWKRFAWKEKKNVAWKPSASQKLRQTFWRTFQPFSFSRPWRSASSLPPTTWWIISSTPTFAHIRPTTHLQIERFSKHRHDLRPIMFRTSKTRPTTHLVVGIVDARLNDLRLIQRLRLQALPHLLRRLALRDLLRLSQPDLAVLQDETADGELALVRQPHFHLHLILRWRPVLWHAELLQNPDRVAHLVLLVEVGAVGRGVDGPGRSIGVEALLLLIERVGEIQAGELVDERLGRGVLRFLLAPSNTHRCNERKVGQTDGRGGEFLPSLSLKETR